MHCIFIYEGFPEAFHFRNFIRNLNFIMLKQDSHKSRPSYGLEMRMKKKGEKSSLHVLFIN